jgi:hypothetical protein
MMERLYLDLINITFIVILMIIISIPIILRLIIFRNKKYKIVKFDESFGRESYWQPYRIVYCGWKLLDRYGDDTSYSVFPDKLTEKEAISAIEYRKKKLSKDVEDIKQIETYI